MKTVILRDHGINWMFYMVAVLDEEKKEVKITKEWRAHKFEDRGLHPDEAIDGKKCFNQVNIKAWMNDGRPGGVKGLRANYRRPDYIKIGDENYTIVK